MTADSRGAYGERIARTFSAEETSTLATELRGETFAVTRTRSAAPNIERTPALAPERALLFGIHLVDRGNVKIWTAGRLAYEGYVRAGTLSMIDVETEPSAVADGPQDQILFYVPRRAIDDLSLEDDGGASGDLVLPPGRNVVDPVVLHLANALLPALANPEHVSRLFFDHVALAFQEHASHTYARLARAPRRPTAALAPWQLRRAKEHIVRDLRGDLSIAELASECGLSRSHFSRAFKVATGTTPHRWLTLRRIEAAKTMMRTTSMPLAAIARACGFAQSSRLSRVFAAFVGTSPRAWRHAHASSSAIGKVK